MQVALGPITASFAGTGTLALDEAAQTATLSGTGRDARTATSLSGVAVLALEAVNGATRTSLTVTYSLRGPLAQLARGPIVQSVAASVAEAVARNLERRLAGDTAAVAGRLSLRWLIWQRMRRWLGLA